MCSITLQVNLHIVVHACQRCVGDTFQSHNQNKGHMFEDDENKATIVGQSKQSVNKILMPAWFPRGLEKQENLENGKAFSS